MKKFEIGKTYTAFSVCDQNCTWSFKVTARTAKTITLDDGKTVKRFRIIADLSEIRGAESVFPLGRYSMAPILSAT